MKAYQILLVAVSAVILILAIPATLAQTAGVNVQHVAARTPVQGFGYEMAAERLATPSSPRTHEQVDPRANLWQKLATLPGAVVHDISFATSQVGYAAAELGQVWKTTNGGSNWTEVMNLGFPYYWYGVQASAKDNDVVVSGFNDSNFEGILRVSHDGGQTWSSDIILTTTGWGNRIRYVNSQDSLEMDQLNLDAANAAHYTTDGGASASDWTAVVPDPSGGWFGNQFSFLPNLHARASGITFCTSLNGGAAWTCGPSIDPVFDGPTFFKDDTFGWVGGGEISPNVEGWVHRTADGGNTWSGRTLDIGWPVREILFLTPNIGWAVGGNVYTGVGGMYFSTDGGQTWSLDANTGAEMSSCARKGQGKHVQIWCAGYVLSNNSFSGVIYSAQGTLP